VTITVRTGEYDRVNVPIRFTLDAEHAPSKGTQFTLVEKVDRDSRIARAFPAQVEHRPDGTAEVFAMVTFTRSTESDPRMELIPVINNALPSSLRTQIVDDQLVLSRRDAELLRYQITPMRNARGGERFPVSSFIHPLRTPSGFVLTEIQPDDHLHHLGVWWPWKFLSVEGKQFNGWEMQEGQGVVRGIEVREHHAGNVCASFTAISRVIDRKNYSQERVILNEEAEVRVWPARVNKLNGYFLDITLTHTPAVDQPVQVVNYRYSGFSIRGPKGWNRHNSTILTSEGKTRDDSNATPARWVRVEGETGSETADGKAGWIMMFHPDNENHPEKLRTWDSRNHDGAIFINVNPVQDKPLTIQPNQPHIRRYRLFVYDGQMEPSTAEALWRDYAMPPEVVVE